MKLIFSWLNLERTPDKTTSEGEKTTAEKGTLERAMTKKGHFLKEKNR